MSVDFGDLGGVAEALAGEYEAEEAQWHDVAEHDPEGVQPRAACARDADAHQGAHGVHEEVVDI